MSELMVAAGGLLLIGLIVWWFWLSGPKAQAVREDGPVDILVKDGSYQPAALEVSAGKPLVLRFTRHDATPCAEKVTFGDLDLTIDLPLGKPVRVELPPLPAGVHEFTCQMGMYRGKLVAK